MEIALLSGAYKNAGDFLIETRAKELLMQIVPDANIHVYLRNKIDISIEEINAMDAIVFTGGPLYMEKLESHLKIKDIFSPRLWCLEVVGMAYIQRIIWLQLINFLNLAKSFGNLLIY